MLLRRRHRGFSLVELMVTILVMGILFSMAAPTFNDWLINRRIRSTAESVLSGLQMARAEAIRRNASVRFQLVSNVTNGCALSSTGPAWIVSRGAAAGKCGVAPSVTAINPTDNDPIVIASKGGDEAAGSTILVGQGGNTTIVFNSLGRILSSTIADTLMCIDVDVPTSVLPAADSRNLRIMVTSGGQVRMCDPNATTDTRDPRYCGAANAGQNRCV